MSTSTVGETGKVPDTYNRTRLFVASCTALVATAMVFSLRTDIMEDLGRKFQLSEALLGVAVGPGLWGFTVSIILWSMVIDQMGLGKALWVAFGGHLIGTTLVIFAGGFWTLFSGWLLIGLANGMVEASINPLAATIYADRKTHMLNILHAWWPGGLIIGGLLGFGLTKLLSAAGASEQVMNMSWQIKVAFVYLPTLIYGGLILGQKFPPTERVAAGVSTEEMFQEAFRPMFIFLLFCMLLTASTELGFNQWVGVLMEKIANMRGILILVYCSMLMFILRHFAGPLVERLSPPGLLLTMSALSGLGLVALSFSQTPLTIFLSATLLGIGVAYFWPTMLGTTSERFPKGGALLLGLMGGAGMAMVGWVTVPVMGYIQDEYTLKNLSPAVKGKVVVGKRVDEEEVEKLPAGEKREVEEARKNAAINTVRWLAVCPAVLLLLFGGFFIQSRRAGGYQREILAPGGSREETDSAPSSPETESGEA